MNDKAQVVFITIAFFFGLILIFTFFYGLITHQVDVIKFFLSVALIPFYLAGGIIEEAKNGNVILSFIYFIGFVVFVFIMILPLYRRE